MSPIAKYFAGETTQCLAGIGISLVSIGLALYFFYLGKPVLKGMGFPFFVISVILLLICAAVVWRTPKDVKRVNSFYASTPGNLKTEELPRMEKVLTSFRIIKRVEMILGIAGIVLLLLFWNHPFLRGLGSGLIIQALIMLTFDIIAESRAKIYVAFLSS